MNANLKRILALSLLLICAVMIALILPALASNDDYGINSGVATATSAPGQAPVHTQPSNDSDRDSNSSSSTAIAPTQNSSLLATNTPEPTNTSAPTATPTCTDGQWGQEPNGAWVCIPNSD